MYSRIGVCSIESIGAPPFGKDDGHAYYKLRAIFSAGSELAYVPVDLAESIRPLANRGEATAYLSRLPQCSPKVCNLKKPADLVAHYQAMLTSGRLEDCLLLVKEIRLKEKELAAHNKRLGQVDARYLKIAERLACEELAAVLQSVPDLMRDRLYAAMECEAAS